MVKPSSLQAFAHRPALVRSKCGFENRIKNTFFIRSVSAYRELLIAAVLVVTIVQHRTSVLDKTACVCSKTSRVEHTKSVHNRPNPAVFVRTAQGLSSNQNEVAINSKSGLWRTALLAINIVQYHCKHYLARTINHNVKLHKARIFKNQSITNRLHHFRQLPTTDAMFTLRERWFCVIDRLRCANDGAGSSHGDGKSPLMTLDRLANGE